MKIFFISFLILYTLIFVGCLKTRNEVKDSEQKQVIQQQVVTLQKTNADNSSRFVELDEQIRELSGKVDSFENKLSKVNPEHESTIKNLAEMQIESNKKLSLLQEEIAKQETQLQALTTELQNLKVANQSVPTDKRNPFQIAEEYFKQNEWKKAIIQYQKYRDEYPKGKQFSESTYKMAVSFQLLNMKEEARAFYDEVISKFPNSPEAKKAKLKLKGFKK